MSKNYMSELIAKYGRNNQHDDEIRAQCKTAMPTSQALSVDEVCERLNDLAKDRESFFRDDGDDEAFRADHAALCKAVEMLTEVDTKDAEITRLNAKLEQCQSRASVLEQAIEYYHQGECDCCYYLGTPLAESPCQALYGSDSCDAWKFHEAPFVAKIGQEESADDVQ